MIHMHLSLFIEIQCAVVIGLTLLLSFNVHFTMSLLWEHLIFVLDKIFLNEVNVDLHFMWSAQFAVQVFQPFVMMWNAVKFIHIAGSVL